MKNKLTFLLVVLLVISIVVNILLLIAPGKDRISSSDPTGFVTTENNENTMLEQDLIEINKEELFACCSFINSKGEEDTCYVLKDFDCGYCTDYCS
ncbi:MAG: hypothetical protein KKF46_05385 [Nanoarchaeota archaeon]|nr:hypothetical protein [Nanoarchaeota archaeon]MBU1321765.1 hypothetical protein [Nanoarchaeota archaeon]MBU1597500.1 hypothetical protein [Nanoarchaeota archaeon]